MDALKKWLTIYLKKIYTWIIILKYFIYKTLKRVDR